MGKVPGSANQELVAFHAAVLRRQKETGRVGQLVPVPEWEALLTRALSAKGVLLTRQSCQDKTWALDRLGLIRRVKGEGVIVLEVPGEPEWSSPTPSLKPEANSTTAS